MPSNQAKKKMPVENRGHKAARTRKLKTPQPSKAMVPAGGATGVSRKGIPNKISATAKGQLEDAFAKMGGVAGLVKWGREHPSDFYKLWARLVPKDTVVTPGVGLEDMLHRLAERRATQPDDIPEAEYDLVPEQAE